ncbi:MAG: ECF-type sigma factor [Phycisphaerales bacterium]
MSDTRGQITLLLSRSQRGDQSATDALLPLVYDELHALAQSYFRSQPAGHTLQPTALVHEACVRLLGTEEGGGWNDRAHFFAVAAAAMRQILVNHALAKRAQKRGGDRARVTLADSDVVAEPPAVDLLDLDEALRELQRQHERMARIVELRYFGGLTASETAEALGVSRSTVEADWRFARAWLLDRLGGGEPAGGSR